MFTVSEDLSLYHIAKQDTCLNFYFLKGKLGDCDFLENIRRCNDIWPVFTLSFNNLSFVFRLFIYIHGKINDIQALSDSKLSVLYLLTVYSSFISRGKETNEAYRTEDKFLVHDWGIYNS